MKKTIKSAWGVFLLIAASLIAAQAPAEEQTPQKPAQEQVKVEEGDKIQVQMQDVEIRGELERPEVFYIIPRRQARMDMGNMRKDYEREILTPVMPETFESAYKELQPKEN